MFLYQRFPVSLFSLELVWKERNLMYNTLSLLSNENRKRESSHQKRRMFGETAWQVAISCQVSLQFAWILSWTRTTALICDTATWRLEDFVLKSVVGWSKPAINVKFFVYVYTELIRLTILIAWINAFCPTLKFYNIASINFPTSVLHSACVNFERIFCAGL